MRIPLALAACLALGSCATYAGELKRGQSAYEQNKNELALAVFRGLEDDQTHFDPGERARYAYLRGMTDYRLGYRADARHWLWIAKEMDDGTPNALSEPWKKKMTQALAELDELVWAGGSVALDKPVSKAAKERDDAPAPDAKEPRKKGETTGD